MLATPRDGRRDPRRRPGSPHPRPRCSAWRSRDPPRRAARRWGRRPIRPGGGAPGRARPRPSRRRPRPARTGPTLLGHDGGVLELERRRPVIRARTSRTSTSETSPALVRRLAVDPRHLQPVGPLARDDLAAGVALELVPAAQPVVAADRQEPAADPLWVRERVPDVLDRRVVRRVAGGPCGRRRRRCVPSPTSRWTASISRTMSIIGSGLLFGVIGRGAAGGARACRARARSRASRGAGPRSGGSGRATRRARGTARRRRRTAAGRPPAGPSRTRCRAGP